MRKKPLGGALVLSLAIVLFSAHAAERAHYSAAKTKIGTLFADPAAKAIVVARFPLLAESKEIAAGKADSMTLKHFQYFKPRIFTNAALQALDAELAQIPGK